MARASIYLLLLLAISAFAASVRAQRRTEGALQLDGVPEISPAVRERIAPYLNARAAELLDFQPGSKRILIATRFGEVFQVHEVAGPGLDRQQLTFYSEPITNAAHDPRRGASGFYFAMDSGGSEFYQLYWFDRAQGKHQLLSDGKSRNDSMLVSNAGGRVAFTSTRRNGKDFDVYTLDASDPASTKLVASVEGQYYVSSWSPDDRQLLLQHYISANESRLYALDLSSGERRELNAAPGKPIAYVSPVFAQARDGKGGVYYAADEDREFLSLTYLDLATGKKTLLRPDLNWDIGKIAVSDKGDWLVYTTNAGGSDQLHLASTRANPTPRQASTIRLPAGVIGRLEFDRTGQRLGFSMSTADSPGDVYTLDTASRALSRWTHGEVGGLDRARFAVPSLIEFPSFDGRKIPAWYYRPKSPSKAKLPVVILIHGGPESQSKASFSALVQSWVNELGVAVLVPNVRGSSGYGKNYLLLDNANKREDSVKDIGALLDWVGTQADLDPARVAVYGGSYGGYMVLASLARYAGRLRCGVEMVGISNFVTFLERTETYRRDLRRAEYGDERDPLLRAYLQSISPTTNAAKIKVPLLVAQGLNDPRVPASEAEQIVTTVRKNGTPVWYIAASDEGHGFQKKGNRDYFWTAVNQFLQQHLLP